MSFISLILKLIYTINAKYKRNNRQSTYIIGWISFARFCAMRQMGYSTKPNPIPITTLEVSGIIIIVKNAGITISNFVQLIRRISIAISAPTIINAADVTSTEITLTSGEKNNATTKHAAITTDVKPVFPPTAIPAEDSTLVAGVDVPN